MLSGLPRDRYLATKDLAEFHGVPKEYLSKALQSLSQAGIVESTLGPSGGYRLAKATADITFLDIVEAVEGKANTFVCREIRQSNPCRPKGECDPRPCGIARVMWDADEAWRQSLRSFTLADLNNRMAEELPPELLKKSFEWLLAKR